MDKLTCFKAYDIRGQLGTELDEDVAYRIGRAYAVYIQPETVVLGGDVRSSSESLKQALASGLRKEGVNVLDIGLAGTEEVYFAAQFLDVQGGIEVTASHNPIDFNGMKLVREGARPISGDSGLSEIQRLAENNEFHDRLPSEWGKYEKVDVLDAYTDKLLSFVSLSSFSRPLCLVVNSGNGAAGHVIDELADKLAKMHVPIEFVRVHHDPDPVFPNGIPNPLLPENRFDTQRAVLEHNADMGIAFDGDFDRCFLFDERGQFIEGYYVVGLLAEMFLKNAQANTKIVHDPRVIWNTIDIVSAMGGVPVQSKTGHAFIKERMRVEDAVYGGEMSAHHYFRDFAYCDSGMIPWLLVAELLSLSGRSLSSLVATRQVAFPSSGEINRQVDDPTRVIEFVLNYYQQAAMSIDRTDGLSLEFEKWRFNLRMSNTESVIRLNIEARGDTLLVAERTEELLNIIDCA